MSVTSSTSEAKSEPPSDSRLHEARAQGHVPRAELVGLSVAACVLSGLAIGYAPAGLTVLRVLVRAPLELVAQGKAPTLAGPVSAAITQLGRACGAGLVLCLLSMLVARAVAQGFGFSLRALSPRKRFARTAATRWITSLLAVPALSVAVGSLGSEALRVEPFELFGVLAQLAFRVCAVLGLLALIDTFLVRAAWFRSLWMTRRERLLEAREAYGTPELRAARERVRREQQITPPVRSLP